MLNVIEYESSVHGFNYQALSNSFFSPFLSQITGSITYNDEAILLQQLGRSKLITVSDLVYSPNHTMILIGVTLISLLLTKTMPVVSIEK